MCLPVTCLYKALNVCYSVLRMINPSAKQDITVFGSVKPFTFLNYMYKFKM